MSNLVGWTSEDAQQLARLAAASERIAAALENITTAFQTADATDTKPSPPAGVTVEED